VTETLKKRPSSLLTAAIWERGASKYAGTMLLVLLKIASMTRAEGYSDPGVRYLAARCGCKERQVQRILRTLEQDKILITEQKAGSHGQNRYRLQLEEIRKLEVVDAAYRLATRYKAALVKNFPEHTIDDNWRDIWPNSMQSLIDRGFADADIVRVTGWALKQHFALSCDAPKLVENFQNLTKLYNTSLAETVTQ
jgi:DNA-binding transcriptional regulator YhcF (GntR family)